MEKATEIENRIRAQFDARLGQSEKSRPRYVLAQLRSVSGFYSTREAPLRTTVNPDATGRAEMRALGYVEINIGRGWEVL